MAQAGERAVTLQEESVCLFALWEELKSAHRRRLPNARRHPRICAPTVKLRQYLRAMKGGKCKVVIRSREQMRGKQAKKQMVDNAFQLPIALKSLSWCSIELSPLAKIL